MLFYCFDWNVSGAARINLALRFGAPENMEVELTRKSFDVSLNQTAQLISLIYDMKQILFWKFIFSIISFNLWTYSNSMVETVFEDSSENIFTIWAVIYA